MGLTTKYIQKYNSYAMDSQNVSGVPASITLAQGILESANGTSGLTVNANNHFGAKTGSKWTGEVYRVLTKEYLNGGYITITANFRKYKSAKDSFIDHANIYAVQKAKKAVGASLDYVIWANALKAAGYATDPLYASKLINIINSYQLYKYDAEAPKKKNRDIILLISSSVVVGVGLSLGVAFYKKKLTNKKQIVLTCLIGFFVGLVFSLVYLYIKKLNENKLINT